MIATRNKPRAPSAPHLDSATGRAAGSGTRRPWVPPLVLALIGLFLGASVMWIMHNRKNNAAQADAPLVLADIPFNGARAFEYLEKLCEIGPRASGSAGMAAQQKLLLEHFRKAGAQVELQQSQIRHPLDGSAVPIANLIARWNPERERRILLCAHYDTLPFPMLDPVDPRGRFVGANDGASGVAVLMELAHELPNLKTRYGVDIVLLDAEEFIFAHEHEFFHGSTHFAREYVRKPTRQRYRWGVLLDMVGDADLQLPMEGYSVQWPDTRPLVREIWGTAARLGVREFIPRVRHYVRDDHHPLHDIGRIPCCDVIDFDYPPWHTRDDTPERCSALSLAKVGWVLREWLTTVR